MSLLSRIPDCSTLMNIRAELNQRLTRSLSTLVGEASPAMVSPAGKPEFGDYQANGVMAAAKRTRQNPRALAEKLVDELDLSDLAESVVVAGPGFINIRLNSDFLAQRMQPEIPLIQSVPAPQRMVIDYSSPNLAKEMHVGHLRSTIIGDAMARTLEALGHQVIRQNHVGDWGTQFGQLVAYLEETNASSEELSDLESFYQAAKKHYDEDPEFAERARSRVVALQSGDPLVLSRWHKFIDISLTHCDAVYQRLGVSLTRMDVHAESAYNDVLPEIVQQLEEKGLLVESDGARCVFLDEFLGKDGSPLPVIIQKSDGGYLYATTDLAAIQYRCKELAAQRVLYFVDSRQALHFRQVFAVARLAGFCGSDCRLEYHPFGKMLGKNGKPFSTREGGVVKLDHLLDEAVMRAGSVVREKNPSLSDEATEQVAQIVGIGAVKYADLSKNRTSDYIFDWDQMLSFEGNTAPYLQYAYARIRSLFRRGGIDTESLSGSPQIDNAHERQLALTLARFQETLELVATEAFPHYLCGYLYELAARYMQFYEHCPVLNAPDEVKQSRLLLCKRSADTLQTGLGLLGIETLERM